RRAAHRLPYRLRDLETLRRSLSGVAGIEAYPRTDGRRRARSDQLREVGQQAANWFWRGLLGHLLNPKVGAFYVSFLPLFVPDGVPVGPYVFVLAVIHAALGVAWFAALIVATQSLSRALRRPRVRRTLDVLVGCMFVGMGLKLALSRP